ncbi:MAG: YdeI/OmpD-associated family protein [Acidobacteriota bacterium]
MADDVLFFARANDFRDWLARNHDRVDVQWVGYWKVATGKPSISWQESVDEALCFGWIDGLRRSIDEASYKIRFTPRRDGSVWSAKNIASAEKLVADGRMKPPGQRAFERRKEDKSSIYSYERREKLVLSREYEKRFRSNKAAWKHYQGQPPGYRSKTAHWVMVAKREETRLRRLQQLIDYSAEQAPIPAMVVGRKKR